MRSAYIALMIALCAGACSEQDPAPHAKPKPSPFEPVLVFSIPLEGYFIVPGRIRGRAADDGGYGAPAFAEALLACGQSAFAAIEVQQVYLKSTRADRRIVACVRDHVSFSFDATLVTHPAGIRVVPAEGVAIAPE